MFRKLEMREFEKLNMKLLMNTEQIKEEQNLVGENNAPTVKSWDSHPLGETYQVNKLSDNEGNLLIAGKH